MTASQTNGDSNIVVDTAERIFADLADPQTIIHSHDDAWRAPLWQALADSGLTLAWVPEEHGGAGVSLADGYAVLGAAGRSALSLPLAETMIAGWLLAQAGLTSPPGMMSVAPARPRDRIMLSPDGTLSGRARGVSFARDADYLAVLAESASGPAVALVRGQDCRIAPATSLAGEPSDTVTFDAVTPERSAKLPPTTDAGALMLIGAAARSAQISGALETLLDLSVSYANERVAFEKPLAKFQAVQHNLAKLAGEVAAALTAAVSAADAFSSADVPADALYLEAAAAKIRCGEAAEKASAIAHQTFGAIGFTSEHVLHRYTLRALGWRDDFGSESHWATELGRRVARHGADELWPLVASR